MVYIYLVNVKQTSVFYKFTLEIALVFKNVLNNNIKSYQITERMVDFYGKSVIINSSAIKYDPNSWMCTIYNWREVRVRLCQM